MLCQQMHMTNVGNTQIRSSCYNNHMLIHYKCSMAHIPMTEIPSTRVDFWQQPWVMLRLKCLTRHVKPHRRKAMCDQQDLCHGVSLPTVCWKHNPVIF